HGRSPDSGRVALPLLRGEPGVAFRQGASAGLSARHPRRDGGALRARTEAHGDAVCLRGGAPGVRIPGRRDGRARRRAKMSVVVNRRTYAEMYGPTTGDRLRLGDTALVIEVERDHTVLGEEVKFGG